jgi:tetratricopeptide (TPR) repeat protein
MCSYCEKYLLLIIGICFSSFSYSQVYYSSEAIDTTELKQKLIVSNGVVRAGSLIKLAYYFRISDPERSLVYSKEAHRIAEKEEDQKLILLAKYNMGLANHHQADYPEAVRYGLDALDLAEKSDESGLWLSSIELLVLTYLYSNNPDLAMKYSFKARHLIDVAKSDVVKFDLLIRIGWVCKQTASYKMAIPYFEKAASVAKTNDSIIPASRALNFYHLGDCYYALKKYDSAMYFFLAANSLREEYKIKVIDRILTSIGRCYLGLNQHENAISFFNQSMQLSEAEGEEMNLAHVCIDMGNYLNSTNHRDEAIKYYRNAIVSGQWVAENHTFFHDHRKNIDFWFTPNQDVPEYYEIEGYKIMIEAYRKISEIMKANGDYRSAYESLYDAELIEKLLIKLYRRREVSELNTRYETNRKDQQIQALSREMELKQINILQSRYIILGMAGLMLLTIIVLLLLMRQKNIRLKQRSIALQQRLLRSQMNPHFIYNSLSCVQSFILSHEPDMASKYLAHFARLMRNILSSSTKEFVTLEDEIATVENYLELQKVRFPDKFDFKITVDRSLDTASIAIPPMIAQPFIENAIEHGIKHKETKGLIEISVRQNTGSFIYEIRDDGIGREKAKEILSKSDNAHQSMATSITHERLEVFNRKRKNKILLSIFDLKNDAGKGVGTLVIFEVPMKL